MTAQRDLSVAQSALVTAQTAYEKAKVDLDKAVGTTLEHSGISIEEAKTEVSRRRVGLRKFGIKSGLKGTAGSVGRKHGTMVFTRTLRRAFRGGEFFSQVEKLLEIWFAYELEPVAFKDNCFARAIYLSGERITRI